MWQRAYNRMYVVSVTGLNHEQHISKYAIIYGVEDLRMWTSQNRDSDLFAVKKKKRVRIKVTNPNFASCCIWAWNLVGHMRWRTETDCSWTVCSEEVLDMCCSPGIVRVMKWIRMRWMVMLHAWKWKWIRSFGCDTWWKEPAWKTVA